MAQSTLTWTPAGGPNSNSQLVQYRVRGAGSWTTFSTETPGVSAKTITGLVDNQIYEFRIINNCAVGGPIPSAQSEGIKFTCPQLTVTKTYNSVTVAFSHMGASIDDYQIKIYNSSNSLITTYDPSGPYSGTISHTFTGLSASTTYNVRVIPFAETYSKADCATYSVITDPVPSCDIPSVLTASMT